MVNSKHDTRNKFLKGQEISYTKVGGSWRCFKAGSFQNKRGGHISVYFPRDYFYPAPAEASALLATDDQSLKEKRVLKTRGNDGATVKKLNLLKWPTCIVCFSGYV